MFPGLLSFAVPPPPACAPWGFRAAQLSRAEESRLHPCSSAATSFPQPLTPQCAPLWCVSVLPFPPFPPSPSQRFFRASDSLLTHLRVSAPVASSSFPWCPSVHFPERSWIVVSSLPPVGIARALKNADARLTPPSPGWTRRCVEAECWGPGDSDRRVSLSYQQLLGRCGPGEEATAGNSEPCSDPAPRELPASEHYSQWSPLFPGVLK